MEQYLSAETDAKLSASTSPSSTFNQLVQVDIANHIATITLNDPKSLNAFGTKMATELMAALHHLDQDKNVRVIVLQGANGNFSSGGHIKEMLSVGMESSKLKQKVHDMVDGAGDISRKIRDVEKPIIAKLQGAVAGAGFNLALTCDFRIASDDATFIQAFIHIGLVPDAGGIYVLNQLIGAAKTTELAMLGDKVTAAQAHELNLVNQVVSQDELDAAVDKLAKRLVKLPATALTTIKLMMNATAFDGLRQALDMETQYQSMLAGTDDFKEGITAFVEKRPPNYL